MPKDVYTHRYCTHLYENYLLDDFLNYRKILTYRKMDCVDVFWRKKFVCANNDSDAVMGFKFEHGKLLGYLEEMNGNVIEKEYSYNHLQKRSMQEDIKNMNRF